MRVQTVKSVLSLLLLSAVKTNKDARDARTNTSALTSADHYAITLHSTTRTSKLQWRFTVAANWKHFHLQVWTNYPIITGLEKQTEEYKVALFLHCIGHKALKMFNGFWFDDESDRKKLDKMIEK